jgi:hypothetical protein
VRKIKLDPKRAKLLGELLRCPDHGGPDCVPKEALGETHPHGDGTVYAPRFVEALRLLEEHDRAWREGTPPPIEKGRVLLSECGRSATWPEGT